MGSQLQSRFACILLCAGASQRMKRNKLLLPFGKKTIFETTLDALNTIPFIEKVMVHSPAMAEFTSKAKAAGFGCINNPMPEKGMHRSIRLGIQSLSPRVDSVLIALADQPFLRADHYWQLIKEFDRKIEEGKDLLRPVVNSIPGNPSLISLKYRNEILIEPDQDRGCSYLFHRYPQKVFQYETQDRSFIMDIDTPEDYQRCVI